MWNPTTPAERFFWRLTGARWLILPLGLALIAAAATYLPGLTRDTTSDSFIRPDEPARVYRERVEELFGLRDPIAVAVIHEEPPGVFNPRTLALVGWLTERIAALPNVDPDRVTSLATERNVVGTADGMEVEDFFETPPDAPGRAEWMADAVADFPLYQGSLVARDGTATLVVAEILDEQRATETYDAILALVREAPRGPGDEIHVAGEGAVSGYLSTYIDRDARRFTPVSVIVITAILVLAFRTVAGTLLPNLIVVATLVLAFGAMAAAGVSFFVITNGLNPALIGIAVADSIHLFSAYYERAGKRPGDSQRALVVQAFAAMWRPVTLTSLTTVAGFLALWPTATMPPLQYFGLFGAVGVAAAWLFTISFLPAAMTLLPRGASRLFRAADAGSAGSRAGSGMRALGAIVLGRPRAVAATGVALLAIGAIGASRVIVEESRIENFHPSEPIYQADKRMNAVMDGTYHLDVLVDTGETDGLFDPERLRRIESLQRFLESLPGVGGTTSIADYVKQMHRAVNEGRPEAYVIPDDPLLVAQLFKLYEASADPTDFEEEMDYEHRRALVRASVSRESFSRTRRLVETAEPWLASAFADGTRASLTGRLHVNYHWIRGIRDSVVLSVVVSGLAVLAMCMLAFRSLAAGFLASVPVWISILFVYGVMGFGGIWLGVGTAMFASIAIGLGVDFGIHTVDQVRTFADERHGDLDAALEAFFRTTSRALFFNFAAVALGFGVLLTSEVPPLVRFGGLVGIAIGGAFLGSVTLLPALIALFRPRFFGRPAAPATPAWVAPRAAAALGALWLASAPLATPAAAADLPDGRSLMEKVVARDEGEWVSRRIRLELEDRRGTKRIEETRSFRRYYGRDKKTVIFYLEPTNVRDTAFLTWDYADPERDDDQWLYLPALRKVRRISASDRGDYFLGTDLTYEEIKKENKVELSDYRFRTVGRETVDGADCWVIESVPVDDGVAKELGYSRVLSRVDPAIWMSRKVEYWDLNGNPLKTLHNEEIAEVNGIWTVLRLFVENHKTKHRTRIHFTDVDYETPIDDGMFEQRRLTRGL